MRLPTPRGPLSEGLFDVLRSRGSADLLPSRVASASAADRAVSLWMLYQLHYRRIEGVAEDREWDPELLAIRALLEAEFEQTLLSRFTPPSGREFVRDFFDWVAQDDGASLAAYVHRHATRDQVLEMVKQRSVYHLMESDATAWVVPRLGVRAKAALMEIQFDEYGAGDPNRLHHHLFARGMAAIGLDTDYGAYLDEASTEVLEQNNAMSFFGLHRRHRGAALGHLAAFEATSSLPSRRMAQGLQRLGLPTELIDYYLEHIEADAVHEQLAVRTVVGALLEEEPALQENVWFGAFTCLDLEDRMARALLRCWDAEKGRVA